MSFNTVVSGTAITATWGNQVRDQLISTFANAAARNSAITAPQEGQYADLADVDALTRYTGASWLTVASSAAWTDFSATFAITAATTNPTKGNSTYAAAYVQYGKTIHFFFTITIGSTYAAGTGVYRFLLPVTAAAALTGMGSVWVNDSGTALRVGSCIFVDTTHIEAYIYNITGGPLDSGGPGTVWATGDKIAAAITYQAA